MISQISVTSASTLAEAYSVLAARPPGLRVLAGGTDLMVQINARVDLDNLGQILDIWGLHPLRGVELRGDKLIIGALTTYMDLIQSPLVRARFPALADVSREVGAWAIQNRGTLGGNVCNASPAGDTLPLLLAADAQFILGGPRGERAVAASDFFVGYRKTALAGDELLLRVEVPTQSRKPGEKVLYRKVGTRRAQSISRILLAVGANVVGKSLHNVRLAAGCVAPVPLRCRAAESALEGKQLDPEVLSSARDALEADIHPIDDIRGTAEYRRTASANVMEQLLSALVQS